METNPIRFKVYCKENKEVYDVLLIDYDNREAIAVIDETRFYQDTFKFDDVEFKPIVGKDYFGIDVSLHDIVLNSPMIEDDLGIVVHSKKYNCFGIVWSDDIEDYRTIDDLIKIGVDFANFENLDDFRTKNQKIMENENLKEQYEKIIEFLKNEKTFQIKEFLEERVYKLLCDTIGYDKFVIFNDKKLIIKDVEIDDTYQYIVYFTVVISVNQEDIEIYMLYDFEKEEFALVYEDLEPTYESDKDFLNTLWVDILVNCLSVEKN